MVDPKIEGLGTTVGEVGDKIKSIGITVGEVGDKIGNHERRIGALEASGGTRGGADQPQDQQPRFVGDGMIEVPYRLRVKVPSLETEIKLTEAEESVVPVAHPRGREWRPPSAYEIARAEDFTRQSAGVTRAELREDLAEMGNQIGVGVGHEVEQALTSHTKEVAKALTSVKSPASRATTPATKPTAATTTTETEVGATETSQRDWATWIVTGAVVLTALAVIALALSRLF